MQIIQEEEDIQDQALQAEVQEEKEVMIETETIEEEIEIETIDVLLTEEDKDNIVVKDANAIDLISLRFVCISYEFSYLIYTLKFLLPCLLTLQKSLS